MTAIAVSRRRGGAPLDKRLLYVTSALGLTIFLAGPAAAQIAGNIAVDSDYRLRGYSLTGGHPAASAQVTYDDPSGMYANLLAIAQLAHGDARLLGAIGNVGYAKRLSPRVTLDVGVIRSELRSASRDRPSFDYTELYAGAYVGRVMGRLSYSPDYRLHGVSTLYGELESGFEPARNWRISGHVGMLVYLNSSYYFDEGSTHHDWRLGVSRQFGNLDVHAAVSGGGPSEYNGYRAHKKTALTAGASYSF